MNHYPQPCIGIGRLLGHRFEERGVAEKQITCNRCAYQVTVEFDAELKLQVTREETRRLIAERALLEELRMYGHLPDGRAFVKDWLEVKNIL